LRRKHGINVPGLACKNLLLCDKKEERFFLVILPALKRFDLKIFKCTVGEGRISFAHPDALMRTLGLEPGAVSPFGLLNDSKNEIKYILVMRRTPLRWLVFIQIEIMPHWSCLVRCSVRFYSCLKIRLL